MRRRDVLEVGEVGARVLLQPLDGIRAVRLGSRTISCCLVGTL